MKYYLLPLLILPALALTLLPDPSTAPAAAPENVPAPQKAVAINEAPLAVLELFTSQGCSSCPPADNLLRELNERSLAGENIIALSYHVDYWNYLGWKDPYSSAYYSARQKDYTERIGARTYTPQLVVNGREEMIGSRRGTVQSAVAKALQNTQQRVAPILTTNVRNGKITAAYTLAADDFKGHRVTALLAQNVARSAVKRGENRGKELQHHNVVRLMEHRPAAPAGTFELALPDGLSPNDVTVVLLVQNTITHALVGAARSAISAR
ncbi:MAG: DUF1223 domain-containing protein [Lewinella sp.]